MNRCGVPIAWSGSCVFSMSQAQDTETPSVTVAAAAARTSGVTRFNVPSWSSSPQRPQLESESIHETTVSSEGISTIFDLLAAGLPAL